MKRKLKIFLFAVVFLGSFAFLTWYANQEPQRWEVTRENDSIEFYERYLIDFPEGPHAAEAEQRLSQLQPAQQHESDANHTAVVQESASASAHADSNTEPLRLNNSRLAAAVFSMTQRSRIRHLREMLASATDRDNPHPFAPPYVLLGKTDDVELRAIRRALPREYARRNLTRFVEQAATAVFIELVDTSTIRICLIDVADPSRICELDADDLPQKPSQTTAEVSITGSSSDGSEVVAAANDESANLGKLAETVQSLLLLAAQQR